MRQHLPISENRAFPSSFFYHERFAAYRLRLFIRGSLPASLPRKPRINFSRSFSSSVPMLSRSVFIAPRFTITTYASTCTDLFFYPLNVYRARKRYLFTLFPFSRIVGYFVKSFKNFPKIWQFLIGIINFRILWLGILFGVLQCENKSSTSQWIS